MIPPFLAGIAAKYGAKLILIIGAIAAVLFVIWSIYDKGYNVCKVEINAEWMQREAEINDKSQKLLAQRQAENEAKEKENHENYTNAIKEYVAYNEELKRDYDSRIAAGERLRIRAKCPEGSGSAVSNTGKIPQTNTGSRAGTDFAELGREDSQAVFTTAREVDEMAKICDRALGFIKRNNMVE